MNLVVVHFVAQGCIHLLVATNEAEPFKLDRHHHSLPMTAIAADFNVVAGQARSNHGLYLFGGHGVLEIFSLEFCSLF
jgi:hypothetical protein